jgi:hypothetical protein
LIQRDFGDTNRYGALVQDIDWEGTRASGSDHPALVYESYEIDGGNVFASPGAEILKLYFASSIPNVLHDLSGISWGDEDAVLAFVRQWGLLGSQEIMRWDFLGQSIFPLTPDDGALQAAFKLHMEKLNAVSRGQAHDRLAWIWAHAQGVRLALAYLDHCQTGNPQSIRDMLSSAKATEDSVDPNFGTGHRVRPIRLPNPRKRHLNMDEVGRVAMVVLNLNLRGVSRRVGLAADTGKPLGPTFLFPSLLNHVYWHLANAFEGGIDLAKCEECGKWFAQTHRSQRFCPPPPGIEKSRCGSRNRTRRNRQPDEEGAS